MPGARCTRSLMCEMGREHTSIVTTGSPVSPGIPARNGFNGFLRALLGDRLVCHRRWWNCFRQLDAGIEASGPHDFAVRLRAVRQQHVRVHRIPPRVRDDRDTPLEWDETGIAIFLFLPTRQAKIRKFRTPAALAIGEPSLFEINAPF
jgi:hypothetical protein